MNAICETVLKACTPCDDDPIQNISAEDADSDRFLFNFDIVVPPRLGFTYEALGCKEWCYSDESLFDAQLCATQQAFECVVDTWREPQTGDPPFPPPQPPHIFLNAQQECVTTCPDGSTFGATIFAGTVSALNQAEANRIANSLACQRARQLRICIRTTSPLTPCCLNTPYSKTLQATGGTPWVITFSNTLFAPFCANPGDRFPYVWKVTNGSLPDGLELGECSGIISGTPTSAGTYNFTVRATDYIGSFQTKTFTMQVAQITTASPLPDATVGTPYTQNMAVSPAHDQETETWTIIAGTIPVGLTMSTAGILSGTPTTDAAYNFTVNVGFTLDGQSVTCQKQFALTVTGSLPTFYWTLDDTLVDSVAAKALVAGGSVFGAGIINNGFRFNLGGTPRAVETNSDLSYTSGNDFSFSFWLKWASDFDANDRIVIKFDDGTINGPPNIILTWFRFFGVLTLDLEVDDGVTLSDINVPFTVTLGQWYFFTVVYDATTGIATLYQDTVAVQATPIPVFLPSVTTNRIAFWSISNGALGLDYIVDETGWWFDHKLTASEIAFLYNSGSANRPSGI